MQFAYTSSKMPAPLHVKTLSPSEALAKLPLTSMEYTTQHAIQEGDVEVSVADIANLPSNSPYGSWMTMYFPLTKNVELRQQYQLLNLNSLRAGRIMSIVDSLCSDSCTNYLDDFEAQKRKTLFLTAMMDGLSYQSRLKAD